MASPLTCRRRREHARDQRPGVEEVLHAVQDEQHAQRAQVLDQALEQSPPGLLPHPERLGDGGGHQGRVRQLPQGDDEDAVGEGREQVGRDPQGQARLPDAAGAGQRQQPDIGA